ncbi:helicase-related protein [Rhizosaccharibacter radicis]|uniref:Helicase C-terminal domain-containing protein n=1 Tax=Rhizosaccharibacter radicis TaxID=2782605 RepID=A0ABT1VU24_9PROT|nr:hypothetical protein [Acetobacteraceae bacterium KSS12]
MSISPAEQAIDASGLDVDSAELPRLLRLVSRRLPADRDTVAAALCEVRRKNWTGRLIDRTQRAGRLWVRREDAAEAAARTADPVADDQALLGALDAVLRDRFRDTAPDPARALELVLAEVFDAGGRVLSAPQHETLAQEVARAFGENEDAAFLRDARAVEQQRRAKRERAETGARARRREEMRRLRDWERSLVGFREVPAILGCTPAEAMRWIAERRLPVARRVPGAGPNGSERWDFDPAELEALRPALDGWRTHPLAPRSARDQGRDRGRDERETGRPRERGISPDAAGRTWRDALAEDPVRDDMAGSDAAARRRPLGAGDEPGEADARPGSRRRFGGDAADPAARTGDDRIGDDWTRSGRAEEAAEGGWRERRTRRTDERELLRFPEPGSLPAVPRGGKAANQAVARVAALDRYAAHFRTARALKRRIILVTGPTNSGKSYTALNRLAGADSGMALAPLRLLAHEFRESLLSRGTPASLSTGEERITDPTARHLAATVEMCPMHAPVDVAVVDEAQMLFDPDRGAAWTAAIMGAPARELFVLGAPDCVPMVKRIAALCDDPLEEIRLDRKGPLVAARDPVKLGDLGRGDALIAFSRRDVLDLRAALQARGRRVAVVYGALSPEVRRAEAARFNDGDADILVATDAIGMGLNLNIRRVVFSALSKFDGTKNRDLLAQEIKQIGGRAGRYGMHEAGVVAVLAGAGSPSFIRTMLASPPAEADDLRPLVQPDADIVRAVAAEIGSDSLFGVLARIRRAVLRRDDPNYRLADMGQAFSIATATEGIDGLDLTTRWVYAMCPVDDRDNGIPRLAAWAHEHAAGRTVPPPGIGRLPAPDRASREELEQAEKRHKRLVAWRWLSLRFPETYKATEEAEDTTARINDWIEGVLRQQVRTRGRRAG